MHAVARPPPPPLPPLRAHRDDPAAAASAYTSRESSMYPEQNVNGWTVMREPRHHSTSEESMSEDGGLDDMDVDRALDARGYPAQGQGGSAGQQWYRQRETASASAYADMPKYPRDHHGSYTLPPLSPPTRRSPTLPVHLSLPIPPTLPFPSSKSSSPSSAPPHAPDIHAHHSLLRAYHPASAHPGHEYEYESARDHELEYRRHSAAHAHGPLDLPPISPSASLSSALASSKLAPLPHQKHHSQNQQHQHQRSRPPHRDDPPNTHLSSGIGLGLHSPTGPAMNGAPPQGGPPKQIVYTDDASTKLGSYIRRRCYNCHTPDSAAWRRSGMHPGKVLCNKCGLYERTHQKDRPHDPAELRSKPRKTLHQKLAGPGVSPVAGSGSSGGHASQPSPVDGNHAVPPRPLNTHASLLAMRGPGTHPQPPASPASPSIHDEHMQMRDDARFGYHNHHPGTVNVGVGSSSASSGVAGPGVAVGPGVGVGAARHPHTLGSLLNHPHPSPQTQAQALSRSASPRSASGAGANRASVSPTISSSADPATTPTASRSPTLTSTATATSAPASTTQTRSPGGTKQLHLSPVAYTGPLSPHLSHAQSPHAQSPHLQSQSHPASPYQSHPGSPHPHVHSPRLSPRAQHSSYPYPSRESRRASVSGEGREYGYERERGKERSLERGDRDRGEERARARERRVE